jgi:hypothetical protein
MWDAADGKLVDMSSDTLPGLPTQEQILEMRAKGVQPAREGGFGYLRGPDGIMIENAQAGNVERFNHIHMYHEHPICAMQWYITHLGATLPQGRGGAPGNAAGGRLQAALRTADLADRSRRPASCAIRLARCSSTTSRSPSGHGRRRPRQHARPRRRSLGAERRRSRFDGHAAEG